ncbi:MAG: type II secretion system protein GspH [Oceanospirillaceae bacterium]|nr:type II secretion system protein GspH [Oceanospirillaceae bacterium]
MRFRRAQSGFSLLELMLVLALIGLISGLGLAMLGGDPGRLYEARLEQLAARFEDARARARLQGWVIGWVWDERGYRFVRLRSLSQGLLWEDLGREGPGDSPDWPDQMQLAAMALSNEPADMPLYRIWMPGGERLGPVLQWRWPEGQAQIDRDGRLAMSVR